MKKIIFFLNILLLINSLKDDINKTIVHLKETTFNDGICYRTSEINLIYFTISFDYDYYSEIAQHSFEVAAIISLTSEDSQNSFDSICKGWVYYNKTSSYLKCVSEFGIFISGKYHAQLDNAVESQNWKILPFEDKTSKLNVNDYYRIPLEKTKTMYHNYRNSNIGYINIEFTQELDSEIYPKVYLKSNDEEIKCGPDGNTLTCPFTNELLPVDEENPQENKKYELYMKNYCDVKEVDVTVYVKRTNI